LFSRSRPVRDQSFDYIELYHPNLKAIKFSTSLDEIPAGTIAVGNAQSFARRRDVVETVDLAVIDEAHQARRGETLEYGRTILPALKRYVGLTATPFGMGGGESGRSTETAPIFGLKNSYFQPPCFVLTKADAVKHGCIALSEPAPIRPTREIDLQKLKTSVGDYAADFVEALDPVFIEVFVKDVQHCLDELPKLHDGPGVWRTVPFLDFCATVEQCQAHSAAFAEAGLNVPAVNGSLSHKARHKLLEGIRAGTIHGVVSCKILDTGFDLPECGLIILSFASLSRARIEQLVGRGMRAYPGKAACYILDFGGNSRRFGSFNWDYPEAIEFDRVRIEKARLANTLVEVSREGGPRTTLNEIRPDNWANFESGTFEIVHVETYDFVTRKGKRLAKASLIFTNGSWLRGIFLGCSGYDWQPVCLLTAALASGRTDLGDLSVEEMPTAHDLKLIGRRVYSPGTIIKLKYVNDDRYGPKIEPVAFVRDDGSLAYLNAANDDPAWAPPPWPKNVPVLPRIGETR
jgi:Helicase conserved C-terminal domain